MREKRITKNIFLLSMFQLWTMDGEGEKMESSYFFPFQCYSLSMIFDSHFHLPSMAARGLSTTLPPSFLGLECGTEADAGGLCVPEPGPPAGGLLCSR